MMMANNDDIFYSDEELSDSELYQGSNLQSNLGSSFYHPAASESIFSNKLWSASSAFSGLSLSPDPVSNTFYSSDNVTNTCYNTIDSPINQISFGISNPFQITQNSSNPLHKRDPVKPTSWSSIAKKTPLQPIKPTNNALKPAPSRIILKNDKSKGGVSVKATETALSAGYRFKAKNPEPDPRYPADQQLMVGPIPGHLEHDVIYNGLRANFQSRGPVCFMFVHKSAVKDNDSGKLVKFGYVVFAEKGTAQKVFREGFTNFQGHKIAVKEMK